MKRIIYVFCLILAAVMLCVACFGYQAYIIDYWYSNEDYVCRWQTAPSIYSEKLNTNTSFYFAQGYSRAILQWSSGISNSVLSLVDNATDADIYCIGDTIEHLQALLEVTICSNTLGVTYYSYSDIGALDYCSEPKTLGEFNSAVVVCIIDRGLTQNQTKKTFTHELGHALGWMGHSTDSNDIMCQGVSSVITLTSNDKNHLKQIYDLYPY